MIRPPTPGRQRQDETSPTADTGEPTGHPTSERSRQEEELERGLPEKDQREAPDGGRSTSHRR
jgi:hypothetical protein